MTKDTNWMVDLLSGKTRDDPVDNYTKLVNRRGLFDDIGDAYIEQSKQAAINGKQKMTNALMAGVGAGMKGSQTQLREAKLQDLENDLKEVVGYSVGLKKQLGAQKLIEAAFSNYMSNNYGDFKKLNDAFGSGDQQTANSLGILLYNRFKTENPDMGAKMPPIDHIYNGKAYLEPGGKTEGVFMKDLLAPLVSTLPPELQKEIPNLTTLTMQNKFKQSDLLENLTIEEKKAGIANQYSSANLHNAQTRKADYEAQSSKNAEQQSENEISDIMSAAGQVISEHGSKGQRGLKDRFYKSFFPEAYSPGASEVSLDSTGELIRGKFFKAFGYRNETEFNHIPTISANNSPEANRAIIQQYRNLYLKTLNTNANATAGSSTQETVPNKANFDFSTIPGAERIK